MGTLAKLDRIADLKLLKYSNNCSVFIETGCRDGMSLRYAKTLMFSRLLTCDVCPQSTAHCRLAVPEAEVHLSDSVSFLEAVLPQIEGCIMFWLDAHFPADRNVENLPLRKEIDVINRLRESRKDVIIVDDVRVYEHGQYENGRLDFVAGLEWIQKYNYNVSKFCNDEGYMILTKG